MLFAAMFVVLGYLGVKSPTPERTILSQLATVYYFAYFIQMPMFTNPQGRSTSGLNVVMSLLLGFWLLYLTFFTNVVYSSVVLTVFGVLLAAFVAFTPWLTARDGVEQEPDRVQMTGLPKHLVWGGFLLFIVLTVVPIKAVAAGGAFACGSIPCDEMTPDLSDKESLQRGAKWFTNYCMGCHSAKFSRFNRVADDLEIPESEMMENLVLSEQKYGDLMKISMDAKASKGWFGATPPDLTLVARSRNPEWLYTYLRNFYADDTRPTGVNNKVFDKVAMPHVMMELQGLPECSAGPQIDSHGHTVRDELGDPVMNEHCGSLTVGATKGSMSTEEFDQAVYDLVNFLEYIAEPIAQERERLGVYVLLFLVVLFVFVYLLNREYWREIH